MPRTLSRVPATLVGTLCATLVLASCGTDTASEPPATGEDTVSESPSDSSSESSGGAPAGSPLTRKAVADLAQRLELAEADVTVEAVEEVTWNDGSLGCAEKGTMYTQALVDGSRITLRAGDRTYEYHSGGTRAPFLCEKPTQ